MMSQKQAELIAEAVKDGHVRESLGEVVISAKVSPDGKEHKREYAKFEALNARGMAAMNNLKIEPSTSKPEGDVKDERTEEQKANGACDYHNYGYDLDVRAGVRASLMLELEGPEKAITRSVKSLVDGGLFNEADAREFVLNKRKEKGLAV